jgi:pimeloyl-ACP methyl ester carboxylesterase
MKIVDVGSGPPLIVVPGIQGRWEWMRPGVEALARHCRVVTFSLADERSCGAPAGRTICFHDYVEQIGEALDLAGIDAAAICGVSYGGLIAASFAARHPRRTRSLVLVSALSPSWVPDARVLFYLRAPRLLAPMFCMTSPLRMRREVAAALPNLGGRLATSVRSSWNVLTHMCSPRLMARRIHMLSGLNLTHEATSVCVPTLLVTGEAALDCVVPTRVTHEYCQLWPHARVATIERTGHIGFITRPEAMAAAIVPFVEETAGEPAKGSALDIPAEPLAGCQHLLARSARLGPLCGSLREQNSHKEPHSGPDARQRVG